MTENKYPKDAFTEKPLKVGSQRWRAYQTDIFKEGSYYYAIVGGKKFKAKTLMKISEILKRVIINRSGRTIKQKLR